ncbi:MULTISPECIES: hypothetical protein [unclassified Brevundimonas]|jgi:hypothetical protein|uniref:hypothetical protein n=1 Tax=unclassified Brevundimonas TaxID=2622653 RepID=UPI000CFE243D|nr:MULTISPECIES: hypothetical protein [unclassified Brevundimonas]PRA34432.1 hypothetical protein CQ024_03435 [Brevundimonas sp. MYb27]PQZ84132.1 hypothetical protein CQ026_02370 [Brevundimonas sp. MYb31]PRB17895.1 hypothetical protein CQ039_02425 [Brevundimonas sp. MYb52]PRB38266.1 hypothetical protein CQ035_02425 [Brevundimonas sp. MYb46]PRB55953.1 hypothetical protein CQ028_00510 [Brevundimonas sp. MYb33]
MKPQLSPDDAHLNRLWRETFGQPMPLIGAPDIARRILRQNGVSARDLAQPQDTSAAPVDARPASRPKSKV